MREDFFEGILAACNAIEHCQDPASAIALLRAIVESQRARSGQVCIAPGTDVYMWHEPRRRS